MLLRQLERRFGALPEDVIARVRGASVETLDIWADQVLAAATLDDVFAGP